MILQLLLLKQGGENISKNIFEREISLIRNSIKIIKKNNISLDDLKNEYKKLLEEYTKLFNELKKIIVISDIQENHLLKLKKELEKSNSFFKTLSERDVLTGLYNRLKFDEIIKYQINLFNRENRVFSLIIIDIDNFKSINDNYGHNFGDKILIEFSDILKNNLRSIDYIFRWGGDEIAIILPNSNLNSSLIVAFKLQKMINDKFKKYNISASFGLVEYNNNYSIDELIELADTSLYNSKKRGRNRISYFQGGKYFESTNNS
ncbi:hypothetical protein JCM30566_16470 [Marinitoga arctica]